MVMVMMMMMMMMLSAGGGGERGQSNKKTAVKSGKGCLPSNATPVTPWACLHLPWGATHPDWSSATQNPKQLRFGQNHTAISTEVCEHAVLYAQAQ
jgi:hypothetical protein